MSETNKADTVAFHKKAVFEGDVENAFRLYAGTPYRQHNPLIEDGMEGLRKFVARMKANRPDAHGEIKARLRGRGLRHPPQPLARLVGQSARRSRC
jgi:predicted SnoaL-like aldol condensation-catalyzing enzyme